MPDPPTRNLRPSSHRQPAVAANTKLVTIATFIHLVPGEPGAPRTVFRPELTVENQPTTKPMDPAAPTPPSSPRSPAPLPAEFKDRRTGLQIFGAFTIVLGVLFALLIPMMILGQTLNAKATGTPVRFRELFFLIVLYGGMATALVWVGIGSCLIRRWARALLLMGSASGLVIGAGSMVVLAFVLPQFGALIKSAQPAGAPPLAEAAQTVAMILIGGMVFVIYVVLPGVWFLFYRSPHVKATCEAHDPVPRWTDACPLPVLTVSLWLALGVPMLLLMPVIYHSVLPCFGVFLSGWPGTLGYLVLATVWAWSARALYRLDVRGWWVLVIAICLLSLSHVLTYAQRDLMEMYSLMGLPEQQLEQFKKLNFPSRGMMLWGSVFFLVPFLGYLIYLRKFFRRSA